MCVYIHAIILGMGFLAQICWHTFMTSYGTDYREVKPTGEENRQSAR